MSQLWSRSGSRLLFGSSDHIQKHDCAFDMLLNILGRTVYATMFAFWSDANARFPEDPSKHCTVMCIVLCLIVHVFVFCPSLRPLFIFMRYLCWFFSPLFATIAAARLDTRLHAVNFTLLWSLGIICNGGTRSWRHATASATFVRSMESKY